MQCKAFAAPHKSIQLLAGISKPPFIMPGDTGMQIDIVKAAFAVSNYDVKFTHVPLSLHMRVYKRRDIDGLITLMDDKTELGLYLSQSYISYQNVVVTLAKNNLNIKQVSDLSKLRVAAFQNANLFLGDNYASVVSGANGYIEIADQKSQLALLFTDRVDAIIMDVNIFKYMLVELQNRKKYLNIYNKEVSIFPLFEQNNYVAGFNTIELKTLFDKGIADIKATGQYQKIVDSYLKTHPL
ncbi:transporter substrate-binding domain-containing protein [Colwellia sp. MSW7]|uniref:Transporter substrate-binding domain-containing protein n=1 Tax=Colwellia maritima TaxID=2912588 RepID=A0ABS9X5L0_9GAMM|nr:transporter substrate-binding domain-containing protein [Colwellia maritima]MCI2285501.1 transporter substrate-binding domain-containing protein [Colwellia maritima]